jgi:flagellar FliJ protein
VTAKRFNFRLERVRALRERSEDRAKEELADSLRDQARGEALLRAAAAQVDGAREATRGTATAGPVSGVDLLAAQAYLERTERERVAAELDLSRREAEVAARRAALQTASRERRVLERLKDRRRAEHERELARVEGQMTDELALAMHRRAKVAGQ